MIRLAISNYRYMTSDPRQNMTFSLKAMAVFFAILDAICNVDSSDMELEELR